MTSYILQLTTIIFVVCVVNDQATAMSSNCALRRGCDKCGEGQYKTITRRNIKVCCDTCSPLFNAWNLPNGRGFCTCRDPVVIERGITGDCWKGKQCSNCNNGYVGSINGISVCCQNCEKSGMALSPNSCNCLHNGP